jgi:prepilin-type N-terminal cleavage/methylation domain-containing protein
MPRFLSSRKDSLCVLCALCGKNARLRLRRSVVSVVENRPGAERRAKGQGFTLLEVLITIAILGLVTQAMVGTFIMQEKAFRLQEQIADAQQNLRAAAESLHTDLINAGAGIGGAQCDPTTFAIRGGMPIADQLVGLSTAGYQFTRGVWAINNAGNVPANIVTPLSPPDILPAAAKNPADFDTLTVQQLDEVMRVRLMEAVIEPKGGVWTIYFCSQKDLNGEPITASRFQIDDLLVLANMQDSAIFRITGAPQTLAAGNCKTSPNKIMLTANAIAGDKFNDPLRHRGVTSGQIAAQSYFPFESGQSWVSLLRGGIYRTIVATDTVYDTRRPRPILMKETEPFDAVGNALTKSPVADQIATMQLGFGVNRPANVFSISHIANPLAGNLEQTNFDFQTVGAGNYVDPARVRSVTVHLLGRTERPEMANPTTVTDSNETMVLLPQPAPFIIGDYTLQPANTGFRYRLITHVIDMKSTYGERDDSAEVHLAKQGCK